ncbi:MAG TPA: YbaK/EbsC family protein [Thermodesulfobacteriota bacterium]
MALTERLRRFLDEQRVNYQLLPHREAFTAQEVAQASHVPGRELAKALVVREDGARYLMVVLPAPCRIDLAALGRERGTRKLSLASEGEIAELFPDCETGAMPPFGNLYNLPVYVDACLPRSADVFFRAGNHHEVVRMGYPDFERLVQPIAGEFCLHARETRKDE